MRVVVADLSGAKRVPNRRVRQKLGEAQCQFPHTPMQGTAIYNAPELLINPAEAPCEFEYGCSADVWSYGCIVFEMLRGVPFVSSDRQDHCAVAAAVIARLGAPKHKAAAQPWLLTCEPLAGLEPLASAASPGDSSFLREMFCWAPQKRTRMGEIISHAWFNAH